MNKENLNTVDNKALSQTSVSGSQNEESEFYPWESQAEKDFYFDIMNEYHQEEIKFLGEQKRISDRILKALLAVKGAQWVSELQDFIKECEVHDPLKIVRKPKGKIQKSDFEIFGDEWVDQYTGYECDDYYGTISIKIDEKRWLEMPYHC